MSVKSDSTRYTTKDGLEIALDDDESRMCVVIDDIVSRRTDGIYKEIQKINSVLRGNDGEIGLVARVHENSAKINKIEKYIISIAIGVGTYLVARLIYALI